MKQSSLKLVKPEVERAKETKEIARQAVAAHRAQPFVYQGGDSQANPREFDNVAHQSAIDRFWNDAGAEYAPKAIPHDRKFAREQEALVYLALYGEYLGKGGRHQ